MKDINIKKLKIKYFKKHNMYEEYRKRLIGKLFKPIVREYPNLMDMFFPPNK